MSLARCCTFGRAAPELMRNLVSAIELRAASCWMKTTSWSAGQLKGKKAMGLEAVVEQSWPLTHCRP